MTYKDISFPCYTEKNKRFHANSIWDEKSLSILYDTEIKNL